MARTVSAMSCKRCSQGRSKLKGDNGGLYRLLPAFGGTGLTTVNDTEPDENDRDDISALAKGGRTNVFGFVLRLVARIPFIFIAGRLYGPEAMGRFAYAVLAVEFVAQLSTMGLRRGLAELLSRDEKPHVHIVADGLLIGAIASAIGASLLIAVPQIMFPNSTINGSDRFLPLVIFAIVTTDISLAALAYRFDVVSAVWARAIVEPWTISLAAWGFFYYSARDGLLLAYLASMAAALLFALWPLLKSYGLPQGYRPHLPALFRTARKYMPLAAADAAEWGSRRLDVAILGLFASPAIVGIYYGAQQVASLPQKLKTSFDPILGPAITRHLQNGQKHEIARLVGQVGFWIIAVQAGIALGLGIPGEAVMGLFGPVFVGGTAAMVFLLAAEVVAAASVVSEAALVYTAPQRNWMLSLTMLGLQAVLSVGLITAIDYLPIKAEARGLFAAAAVALALLLALGFASVAKVRLLSSVLGAPIRIWRWVIVLAVAAATIAGVGVTYLPEWMELLFGVPVILALYGWIIWTRGFGPDDRALFRKASAV
jgi:O-antigen/teichoic acid export membrane protein